MEKKTDFKLKCVTLIDGGAKDWGKHILMPNGVTLCGQPTPEAVAMHPILKDENMKDLISNYKQEEWDITCEKCLQMIDIVEKHKESRKDIN